ncbi:MAG: UDP-N-acetylmuramoyl-L-alanyl-D-glutamate--2,6-diaminopimelate ligase [Candidatus Adiutrix sp.]|jgi:UDP-N-acetylmuramoyl-L-alanyl-D-glutamate--2,6-diaminopimelate ligase|nr:UDP-N-acetylmuramoyl-L-alanyl-D-glutamate--2,6-diaminopimelate ligase [Candidatus Adiutrix sp.]
MISLSRLTQELKLKAAGQGDPGLSGLTEDSRQVRPGWLFAAVPGLKYNGRDFMAEAVGRGAVAVLLTEPDVNLTVPRLIVPREKLRPVMAEAAALIYDRPAEKMTLVGLTGTNGKTTTAYLLESILRQDHKATGVMGTINYRWPGQTRPADNTTPEGPALMAALADMAAAGAQAAVLEVSSHALNLGRVSGLAFDAALFTNLSRDHLDFHQDMEQYYQAKKSLFTTHLKKGGQRAAVNLDDESGRRLASELGPASLTFGFNPEARVRGSGLKLSRNGLSLKIETPQGCWEQSSPLLAEINASNLLGAVALSLILDIPVETVKAALAGATGAPGRLEKVGGNSDYLVLVDYAHTPDALAKALKACRDLEPNRVIVVFGCGGDRDRGKRPLMGRLGGELADLSLITSDNPRTEEPGSILLEVESGLDGLKLERYEAGELISDGWNSGYLLMVDRRAAIREAVRLMEPGDVLLISGKGHEDYQIIGRDKRRLDDREEALKALQALGRAE